MFAVARRKEYEKKASAVSLKAMQDRTKVDTEARRRETLSIDDPFAGPTLRSGVARPRRRLGGIKGVVDTTIAPVERVLPPVGRWLRLLLLPDTIVAAVCD